MRGENTGTGRGCSRVLAGWGSLRLRLPAAGGSGDSPTGDLSPPVLARAQAIALCCTPVAPPLQGRSASWSSCFAWRAG